MPTPNNIKIRAFFALIALILIWSYSWLVMKNVLLYIDAFDFTVIRSVLAAILLLIVLKISGNQLKPPPFIPTFIIGFLQTVVTGMLTQYALVNGGVGKTAVMVYTMPFWLMILSAIFLKEYLHRAQYISIALAVLGLVFILQPWQTDGTLFSSILAIMSGMVWAVSAVVAKRLYAKHTINLLSLTTWQMVYGSLVLVVISLFIGYQPIHPAPYFWFALSYNAVLVTALGWLLWLYVLQTMPANVAGLSMLAVPVGGAFLSWWLLSEQLNQLDQFGMILVMLALVGLYIPSFIINKKRKAAQVQETSEVNVE